MVDKCLWGYKMKHSALLIQYYSGSLQYAVETFDTTSLSAVPSTAASRGHLLSEDGHHLLHSGHCGWARAARFPDASFARSKMSLRGVDSYSMAK